MKKLIALAVPLAVFALTDRAHAQTEPVAGTTQRAARHSRDRIEHDEIEQSRADNAYDLIQGARSAWLNRHRPGLGSVQATMSGDADRNQSGGNADGLLVIVDGQLYGGRESLRQLSIAQVYSVEFVSPAQVRLRFNRDTRDGAVVIYTSAEQDPGTRRTS